MLKSSNLDDKRLEWFDTLTKIPFGEYSKYDVDVNNIEHTKEYIKNIYTNLEKSVWGMNDVKEEILNYVTQCITQPDSKPRVLALCGQPGIGKTKIVRDGISKSLNREMRCFSMGGIKDSSTFFGFDYTYVGSKYGAIVQALIDCKTMNPVLFFDELDKISDTKEGQDIENFLIHLTDPVQNYDFNDKYFNGIPIDISKSLLIFSFNDMESISPILRDRLHIINIPSPSVKDKVNITSKFFVKEFLDNFKLNENEVIFENDIIKYIIDRYTGDESGVRKLRRCIETICMKINTSKLLGECVKELNLSTSKINITLPIKLTKEHIDVFLHVKENNKNDKIPFMYT
jgi:ATP-dependent Lon protease